MELAFWKSIENRQSAAGFEAYLEQFSDGTFAPLARARVAALKRTQTAALTSPSASLPPITPESFVNHPEARDVIMRHYNEMRVVKYQGVSSVVEMVKVSKLRALKIEGEIVTAEVKFRWRAVDYTFVEIPTRALPPSSASAPPTASSTSSEDTAAAGKFLSYLLKSWRPGPESNRRTRICSPLLSHSATGPVAPQRGVRAAAV